MDTCWARVAVRNAESVIQFERDTLERIHAAARNLRPAIQNVATWSRVIRC